MENPSPLRYPGGKAVLYPVIENAIIQSGLSGGIYIEPFAGGASVALGLLFNDVVKEIVINDADKAIYSFWKTVLNEPEWLIHRIETTPITTEEWMQQRRIFNSATKYTKEYGFATFFLNRTNRSGILSAGPIGGYAQNGLYKIDCRFNKKKLIDKIKSISDCAKRIRVYNQDIHVFLKRFLPQYEQKAFVYFDPPYFEKGQRLYLNSFSKHDHSKLRDTIESSVFCDWIITYDDVPEIQSIYQDYSCKAFQINYCLSNKGKGAELMIFKNPKSIPPKEIIEELPRTVDFS